MDIFNADVKLCGGVTEEERERAGPALGPPVWASSMGTEGLPPTPYFSPLQDPGEEAQLCWASFGGVHTLGSGTQEQKEECGCMAPMGTVCSQISVYLGWKRSSLPIAQPRMLMSQAKGTEFDCVSHGAGNGLLRGPPLSIR